MVCVRDRQATTQTLAFRVAEVDDDGLVLGQLIAQVLHGRTTRHQCRLSPTSFLWDLLLSVALICNPTSSRVIEWMVMQMHFGPATCICSSFRCKLRRKQQMPAFVTGVRDPVQSWTSPAIGGFLDGQAADNRSPRPCGLASLWASSPQFAAGRPSLDRAIWSRFAPRGQGRGVVPGHRMGTPERSYREIFLPLMLV